MVGTGPSATSGSVVPTGTAAVAPDVPLAATAVPGPEELAIAWQPPRSDGGTTVTGYEVTSTPASEGARPRETWRALSRAS